MQYVYGDLDLKYEVIGDGMPIIMLNGYFNDLSAWKSYMEPLLKDRANYKRIYLDYPGTGHSHSSPTTKTYHDLLENVLRIIDYVIPGENFIIFGHSVGGLIARGILKRRFDNVNGIMLTCPVVKVNPKERNIEKKLPYKLNVSEDRLKYIRGRINREVVKSRKNTDKDYLIEIRNSSVDLKYNFDDLEQPFLKPALIVAGKQDTAVGYKDLYDLLDNYPRATLSILDNGKHDIQIE